MKSLILTHVLRMSKLFIYAFSIQCMTMSLLFAWNGNAQIKSIEDVQVKVFINEGTVQDAFFKLEQASDFNFVYLTKEVRNIPRISVSNKNQSIYEVLVEIAKQTGLEFKQINQNIHVQKSKRYLREEPVSILLAPIKITGTVIDENALSMPGVTIIVEGSNMGTVTDVEGKYSLDVEEGTVLVFSFVGYQSQRRTVGSANIIDVRMVEDANSLDEVVVVGFGTQKKESVTGAISSVQTKELLQSPVANISNALVGRMPGLFAVQGSGEPGNDQSALRIRGISTFAGGADPLIMVDGIQVDNWNNIDPNEIENITILKDASSTAVYGVRGANGVLLITTKRGKVGEPVLSISSNVALLSFTNLRRQMSSHQYASSFNEALRNDSFITGGFNPRFSDEDIATYESGEDPIFYPNTDWYDLLFKSTSVQTQHNLNISGGTEKVKYFISGGYFSQEGLFNNTSNIEEFDANRVFRRYNFRSNFNFDVTERFKIRVDISSQTEQSQGSNSSTTRIIESAARANPLTSPGIIDGKIVNLTGLGLVSNPVGSLFSEGYNRVFRNYLQGSVRFDHELDFITDGLKAYGLVNYQNNNEETLVNRRGGGFVTYNAIRLPDGTVNLVPQGVQQPFGFAQSIGKSMRTYAEFGINYAKEFGDHYVTGMVNYNQNKLFNPNLAFLIPNALQGVVGRTTYEYDGRYLTEFTFGYNGTENFAEGNRFGFFPAMSMGWVLTEESFFPKNNFVSFLKIRGSYGQVGNDRVGNLFDANSRFLYRPSAFTINNNGYYFGTVGSNYVGQRFAIEGRLGNPLLTWERSIKRNLGIEMSLLNNKIYVTADIFNENRNNILSSLNTVPAIIGATLPAYNLGSMSNRGFDGDISYTDRIGEVGFWLKGNFTFATNVIEFQDEVNRPYEYQMRTGQRLGQYFGLVADGYYESWDEVNTANRPISQWNNNRIQPGDIRYKDTNGDGIINVDDQIPIGYSNFPEKIFGLSIGGSYKGFDISVLFQGASNVSFLYHRRQSMGFFENSGAPDYLVDSWSFERKELGLPISFPRLTEDGNLYNHNYQTSTKWLEDGSYIRLKNVEVGYTFSPGVLNRVGLNSGRFFVSGNNVLTWSNLLPGIDPENTPLGGNDEPYPLVRTINVGVSLQF